MKAERHLVTSVNESLIRLGDSASQSEVKQTGNYKWHTCLDSRTQGKRINADTKGIGR